MGGASGLIASGGGGGGGGGFGGGGGSSPVFPGFGGRGIGGIGGGGGLPPRVPIPPPRPIAPQMGMQMLAPPFGGRPTPSMSNIPQMPQIAPKMPIMPLQSSPTIPPPKPVMPVPQVQQLAPMQDNYIPHGPSLGFRPKGINSIIEETNQLLKTDSVSNMMTNNKYFKKLYDNLPMEYQNKLLKSTTILNGDASKVSPMLPSRGQVGSPVGPSSVPTPPSFPEPLTMRAPNPMTEMPPIPSFAGGAGSLPTPMMGPPDPLTMRTPQPMAQIPSMPSFNGGPSSVPTPPSFPDPLTMRAPNPMAQVPSIPSFNGGANPPSMIPPFALDPLTMRPPNPMAQIPSMPPMTGGMPPQFTLDPLTMRTPQPMAQIPSVPQMPGLPSNVPTPPSFPSPLTMRPPNPMAQIPSIPSLRGGGIQQLSAPLVPPGGLLENVQEKIRMASNTSTGLQSLNPFPIHKGAISTSDAPPIPSGSPSMKNDFTIPNIIQAAKETFGDTPMGQLAATQAILESGLASGKPSGLASKHFNLFGIKGKGSAGSVTMPTTEYINGKKVKVDAEFAKNKSIGDSFNHLKKLYGKSRYKMVPKATDFLSAAYATKQAGYATDPNYVNLLDKIFQKHVAPHF